MNWEVISQSATERTERAVTDDGEVLYRTAWMVPPLSPRAGAGMELAFGFAVGVVPPTVATQTQPVPAGLFPEPAEEAA